MMQIVPNSEVTVGDTIEFKYNDSTYESIITNSPNDNNLKVCIREESEIYIDLSSVQSFKRIKLGPWHKYICGDNPIDTYTPCEGVLSTNAIEFVEIRDLK